MKILAAGVEAYNQKKSIPVSAPASL